MQQQIQNNYLSTYVFIGTNVANQIFKIWFSFHFKSIIDLVKCSISSDVQSNI